MLLECAITSLVSLSLAAFGFELRRRKLEARMTAQVGERYAAYLELEERVRAALGEFTRQEKDFQAEISKSRTQIEHLTLAMDQLEGIEKDATADSPGDFLGVFDEGDANVQAHPVDTRAAERDFEAELQEWERKVEHEQTEKRKQIEQQRAHVADLTERVRLLEPHASALRQREEELAHAQTRIAELEARLSSTGTTASAHGSDATNTAANQGTIPGTHTGTIAHATSGSHGLSGGDADPSELARRIEQAEASARELGASLESLLASSAQGLGGLRETLAGCRPLLDQQLAAREAAQAGERRRQELEQACSALETARASLESERATLAAKGAELEKTCAELEQRCSETEARLRTRQGELEGSQARANELETARAGLQQTCATLEENCARLEKTCATLEQRCSETEGRLGQRESELESATQRSRELEAAHALAERRLETAGEELNSLRRDIEIEHEHLARETKQRAELELAREELAKSLAALQTRLESESTRRAGLVGELDGARAHLCELESQKQELQSHAAEQLILVENQAEMLRSREEEIERLRTRIASLESKLCSTRDTIGGQKSRLVELMEAIQVAQAEQDRHKELLSEQSAHIQEARVLLEQLRPVMDTLEDELERKQPAESAHD